MPIKIKFDKSHNPEKPTFVLTNKNGHKIGKLPVSNLQIKDVLNSAAEVQFDVYKSDIVNENKLSGSLSITAFDVFSTITSEEKTRLGQIEESKYKELINYFSSAENLSELKIRFKKDNVDSILSDGIIGTISSDSLFIDDVLGNHIIEINSSGYIYLYNSVEYGYSVDDYIKVILSFNVPIFVVKSKLWNQIKDFKLIWIKEWNKLFELKVDIEDSEGIRKSISATSLGEAELSQINLYNIEINTEIDIDREDYEPTVLYNLEKTSVSLLNRILSKAPHYKIGHVDLSIANIQRTFKFDNKSIYDAFLEIAEEINCLFKIDCYFDGNGKIVREVNVYDLETFCYDCNKRGEFVHTCEYCGSENLKSGYGNDTNIFVTRENLTDSITFSTDTDSVKNCFRLVAGDDLMTSAIMSCNPNGSAYIWYITDDLKDDMSNELAQKLDDYDSQYAYYNNDYEVSFPEELVESYNNLIDKYSAYSQNYSKINGSIVGFGNLIQSYFDTVDFYLFLHDSLMPSVETMRTTSALEAAKLNYMNLSPIAIQNIQNASTSTMSNAVLQMAKTIIDPRYQVKIKDASSNMSDNSDDTVSSIMWSGKFIVTNYSDEDDTTTTDIVRVQISGDYEKFVEQKIKKILCSQSSEATDITSLFALNSREFGKELTRYSLVRLNDFYNSCQNCLDMLISQGIADAQKWEESSQNLYTSIYSPYYEKLGLIQEEIKLRETEIAIIIGSFDSDGDVVNEGIQTIINSEREIIQTALNFEDFLGEDLWLEFASYRREDTYENKNYVSDGLDNSELLNNALEFLEVAKKDIYKSAMRQHSISSTLKNFLVIKEFEPLVNYFECGNWIRCKVDDEIYKLRIISYTIDYDNFDNIEVSFADVRSINDDDAFSSEELKKEIQSMSSSFGFVARQAGQGKKSFDRMEQWVKKSLDLTNMKIVGNAENQNVSWDEHGFLCREYSDLTETYDAKQLKIINRGLYVTDDNWRTSSAGIGNFMYYDPEDGQMKEDYGVIAKTLVGNLILSEKVGVYNKNNSMVLGENGMLITTEYDNSNTQKDIMTVRRKTVDENGETQYEKILYIDDSGNVILNGSVSITSTTSNGSATLSELTDENRWMNLISNRDSEYDKKFEDQQNTIRELTTKVDTIPGEFNIVIEEKISSIADKMDSITTSMGYTFNNDGLYIRRSGEEIANKIDNNGMYVLRFVGDTASEILTADNKGVNAVNLTARQYLSIGAHARFEDYDNGTDNKRTACYFMA